MVVPLFLISIEVTFYFAPNSAYNFLIAVPMQNPHAQIGMALYCSGIT